MYISLHNRTLTKILREQFKGETPIVKSDLLEQNELIAAIKNKLSTMDGFQLLEEVYYPRYEREYKKACFFKIPSSSKYYSHQEFILKFNELNVFTIEANYKKVNSPVYDLEQIYTLTDKMKSEYKRLDINYVRMQKAKPKYEAAQRKRQENNSLKRQKIKSLKDRAILAKISQIAKEDKFEFCLKEYTTKIKLLVRLTNIEQMEIDIPYKQFQEALQNLRVTIKTIQELRHSGIAFKIRRIGYREPEWISFDVDK